MFSEEKLVEDHVLILALHCYPLLVSRVAFPAARGKREPPVYHWRHHETNTVWVLALWQWQGPVLNTYTLGSGNNKQTEWARSGAERSEERNGFKWDIQKTNGICGAGSSPQQKLGLISREDKLVFIGILEAEEGAWGREGEPDDSESMGFLDTSANVQHWQFTCTVYHKAQWAWNVQHSMQVMQTQLSLWWLQ